MNSGEELYKELTEQTPEQQRVSEIEKHLFDYLQLQYKVYEVPVGGGDYIHAIIVPSKNNNQHYFYVGHGFGGSSLLKFPLLPALLQKGSVVLWEIRGMGMSTKDDHFYSQDIEQIEKYFLDGITALFNYFSHQNISFVCHSFSSYLMLLYLLREGTKLKQQVRMMLLLSPIGITTKEDDYKKQIQKCSDIFHVLLNKFGWAFKLTYKSPLRTICSCCKRKLIMGALEDVEVTEKDKQMLCLLTETLVALPDGKSQDMFFEWFEPRVLPKLGLQPLFVCEPCLPVVIVYGGEADWVDKQGAKRLSEKYPNQIRLINVQGFGHNLPFFPKLCAELIDHYFT